MNTHDIDIELPPLPQGEYRLSPDSRAPTLYDEEAMEAYALAAIEADRKTTEKQLTAYRGLVNSLEARLTHLQAQHDELKKSANPDLLASERAANAILTEELEADRKRRGEPVGITSIVDMCRILKEHYIEEVRRTDCAILYTVTFDQLRAIYDRGRREAPQPAEPSLAQKRREWLSSDPVKAAALDGARERIAAELANRDEPDLAKCAECGAELIHVRPGKWQHPDCSQSFRVAEPVNKTDWNTVLSSWSDDDFVRVFHERPDLADRLRKMLSEPVKHKRRYAQGTALGEFGIIPMCDQVDDEPVKVQSDDLVARLRALARYEHDDVSVADEAADALMSGQHAASAEPVAWVSKTIAYSKYISDARYRQLRPAAQRWYEPYKCASCAAPVAAQAPAANADARDAARYRWLRKGESDDVAVVRGLGAMDYGMTAVAYTYSEEIDGDDLDAAIDAARQGEGGAE